MIFISFLFSSNFCLSTQTHTNTGT